MTEHVQRQNRVSVVGGNTSFGKTPVFTRHNADATVLREVHFWLDHLFRHNNTAAFTGKKMSRSAMNLLAFPLSCTLRCQRRRRLLI